ncbi:MAG: hypothetical protein IT176_12365 [Acidobacteria bacterium]|nr:hypothetical protein [Acidobacteriota bacterium]
MSSDRSRRAARLARGALVERFDWGSGWRRDATPRPRPDAPATGAPPPGPPIVEIGQAAAAPAAAPAPPPTVDEIQREAFARGYAEGERDLARNVSAEREGERRRLAASLGELAALRSGMIPALERQTVDLAIVIASRILHREVTLDRPLLVAMAREALARHGETSAATIRLHPDDFAAVSAAGDGAVQGAVRVVADPAVAAGGCIVESDAGLMDVGVDAQISEVAAALLGEIERRPDASRLPSERGAIG